MLQNAAGKQVLFTIEDTTAIIDSEPQQIEVAPVIIEDKLMLPIRALMETLDGYVAYDPTGVLTLMDNGNDLTAAEAEALALMQQMFLQSDRTGSVHSTVRLAQIDDKVYYRIGRNEFYLEQNGTRERIDLGKNVQYVLGIDREMVYYVTGSANKEGAFVDGHLCRADLDGKGQQVLAEYEDFMLSRADSQDNWHYELPTYFLHGNDADYIIVYGYPSRYGGHSLYRLEDDCAVRLLYLNSSERNWVLLDNELYFILQYLTRFPTGLQYSFLSPDFNGENRNYEAALTDYFFLELLPLSEDSLLAIVNPYNPDTFVEYQLPDSATNIFGRIDTNTLSMELVRISVPPQIILTTSDNELFYINIKGELCRIQLP